MLAKKRSLRRSVNTAMIEEAVAALSERNGSTAKSIFNYLVKTNGVHPSARAEVSLFIGRAVKNGALVMKLPNTFVVPAAKLSSKGRKRKTRRVKRKSATKIRRSAGKKRKQLKKKRSTKRRARVVRKKAQKKSQKKAQKKRSVRRKNRVSAPKVAKRVAVPARRKTGRPVRKCTLGIVYSA